MLHNAVYYIVSNTNVKPIMDFYVSSLMIGGNDRRTELFIHDPKHVIGAPIQCQNCVSVRGERTR